MMRAALLAGALSLVSVAASAECRDDKAELRGDFGQVQFTVEVADDPQERGRGLMDVKSMPRSAGMLFVYPKPQVAGFWMKNTYIPLDMIFMDENGVVQNVHHNAVPHDETVIIGGKDILLVLEINGGLAARYGIKPGDQLRHPAVPQDDAVWACP